MSLDYQIDELIRASKGIYYESIESFISTDLSKFLIDSVRSNSNNKPINILRVKDTSKGIVLISPDNRQRVCSLDILTDLVPFSVYLNTKYNTTRFTVEKVSEIRWKVVYSP